MFVKRNSNANTKSRLKPGKNNRIIYYVFSTNTATDCLVIVWILRTFAPPINTRTALIALLIMSQKTSKFQLKIISKIYFLRLILAIATLNWVFGTHYNSRFQNTIFQHFRNIFKFYSFCENLIFGLTRQIIFVLAKLSP